MYQLSSDPDGGPAAAAPLPWTTPPTDQGHAICDWCGRAIYVPAVPCSVNPVEGLLTMDTAPGLGDRCKWELSTRSNMNEAAPENAGVRPADTPDRTAA